MKRILIPLALTVTLLTGCEKQPAGSVPVPATGEKEVSLTINADCESTKTFITPEGETYLPFWRQFDRLRLYVRKDGVENTEAAYNFQTKVADGKIAAFKGTVTLEDVDVMLRGFVPNETYVYNFKDRTTYPLKDYPLSCKVVNLDAFQNPSLTSFDGHSDFLIMEPYEVPCEEFSSITDISARFARVSAVAKIVFVDNTGDNLLEGVKFDDFSFETSSTQISGDITLNIDEGFDRSKVYNDAVISKKITAAYADGFEVNGTNAVYINVIPGKLSEERIIFRGRSKYVEFEKTIPAATVEFKPGKITQIEVSIDDYCIFHNILNPEETLAEDIRLMQWNVLYAGYTDSSYPPSAWNTRKQAFGPLFEDMDADIICTNECQTDNFIYIYNDLLSATYMYQRNGATGDVKGDNVIFYKKDKYTHKGNGVVVLDDLNRHMKWCKFQSNATGKIFYVGSAHIESKNGTEGDEMRTESCNRIVNFFRENVDAKTPVFLLGDMNDTPYDTTKKGTEPLYTYFDDARETAPVVVGNYSLNKFGLYNPTNKMNVDMIYYRNIVSLSRFQTVTKEYASIRYASDHYPVVMDCKF